MILLGMLTGNMIFIYLGFLPIIYVAISIYLQPPDDVTLEGEVKEKKLKVDDKFTIKRSIKVTSGFGPVVVYDEMPPEFQLIQGNNLNIYWKGFKPLEASYSQEYICTHRGIFKVTAIQVARVHPFDLRSLSNISFNHDNELVVRPKLSYLQRVRRRQQHTMIPTPSESKILIGAPTSDFKEIRRYSHGDPYKNINWKATARINTKPGFNPAVNEYEREGRKVTWIFLDKSPKLDLGNNIRNSFEYAVQATASLTEYYIARQCRVGLAEYVNAPKTQYMPLWFKPFRGNETIKAPPINQPSSSLYPEAGNMQLYKIQRRLLTVKTEEQGENLSQVIRQAKGHIQGTNPLFVIITSINNENIETLNTSIKELSKYTKRQRADSINIMIINIHGYGLAAQTTYQKIAAVALSFDETMLASGLTSHGVSVINWDPTQSDLLKTIQSEAMQR